jgi:hypothetical protein
MSGTNTDITERKRAEEERIRLREQLEQAGKMESLGRMAGGMAHDFNNLLTVINGYSDRLETQLGGGDASLFAAVRAIGAAGRQGVGLIRQLLAFSRKQAIALRPLNLNDVVLANREMLQSLLGEDIELEIRLETGLGLAMADSCQLLQILMNLAVNARDAMQGRGVLTIGTANEESADGAQVTLTVADTGKGIPEWALGAIFDPFFTTKDEGAGTGLGLSMVYGIVKQFGGGITTESSPGTGTSFRIALPRIALPAAPQAESPEDAPTPATAQGEPAPTAPHETILVVEDRGEVRQLAGVLLQSHGYRVLEAIGGEEALDMARHYDGNIHLLLTDVVMPRMSGDELARRFSRLRPDTAVLYMSGFSELFWLDAGPAPADERVCVQKPFTDDQLASAVRGALKAGKAEHGPIKKEPPRILLAEDSAGIRALLTELLEEHGYSVVAAGNAAGALREARCGRFALAVTDLNLPDDSGIGLARSLRAELPGIQIIVMSALLDEATRARALLEGADAAIDKTCAAEVLPVEVERILACAGVPV